MYTNCRKGIADKALSIWFLLQWFLGDATNLIGALLTKQLATQVGEAITSSHMEWDSAWFIWLYNPSIVTHMVQFSRCLQIATAVYFVIIDTLMLTQFMFYVIRNQGLRGKEVDTDVCLNLYNQLAIDPPPPGPLPVHLGVIKMFNCPKQNATLILLPGLMLTLLWTAGNPFTGGSPYANEHRVGRVLLDDSGGKEVVIDKDVSAGVCRVGGGGGKQAGKEAGRQAEEKGREADS